MLLNLILAAANAISPTFTIPALSNQTISTLVVSSAITPTGYSSIASISVSGQGSPLISVNGGAYAATSTISPGQSFTVELTSSSSGGTVQSATVVIGSSSAVFSVITTPAVASLPSMMPYMPST